MKIKLTTRNNWFLFLRPHSVNRSKGQFERKTFRNYLKTFKTQKSQKTSRYVTDYFHDFVTTFSLRRGQWVQVAVGGSLVWSNFVTFWNLFYFTGAGILLQMASCENCRIFAQLCTRQMTVFTPSIELCMWLSRVQLKLTTLWKSQLHNCLVFSPN